MRKLVDGGGNWDIRRIGRHCCLRTVGRSTDCSRGCRGGRDCSGEGRFRLLVRRVCGREGGEHYCLAVVMVEKRSEHLQLLPLLFVVAPHTLGRALLVILPVERQVVVVQHLRVWQGYRHTLVG